MWQFLPLILTCLVRHKFTYNCDIYDHLGTEAGLEPAWSLSLVSTSAQ